jgi:glutathione-independent formaldehyde dehydrogenase
MNKLVASVRNTGSIGVVGVYPPKDPKSPDPLMKQGQIAFDFGEFFNKGLSMGTGQCNVKQYNEYLRDLIHADRAKPSFIVSHHCSLDDAPEAYEHFDAREHGWTKVILHPSG